MTEICSTMFDGSEKQGTYESIHEKKMKRWKKSTSNYFIFGWRVDVAARKINFEIFRREMPIEKSRDSRNKQKILPLNVQFRVIKTSYYQKINSAKFFKIRKCTNILFLFCVENDQLRIFYVSAHDYASITQLLLCKCINKKLIDYPLYGCIIVHNYAKLCIDYMKLVAYSCITLQNVATSQKNLKNWFALCT